MKHLLLTTIAAVVLVGTAFAGPIHDAAENGDLVGVQAELDKGVDVNALDVEEGRTPLHQAAEWGHTEVAELLIASGAYVNPQITDIPPEGAFIPLTGMTPLDLARFEWETETVELLTKHGGYSSMGGKPILHINNDSPLRLFFMSDDELGLRLGISSIEAHRILKVRLTKLGIIEVVENGLKRAKGQRGIATTYRWNVAPL